MTMTLFDHVEPALPVRASDPATSRVAARALKVRVRQRECLEALRWIGVSATADEVKRCLAEHTMERERGECASRLKELLDLGLVVRVGVKPNAKNRPVGTWTLSEAGRAYLKDSAE